ncbi:MAG: IS1096 element passenger TnpR family protein [Dorea sp.]
MENLIDDCFYKGEKWTYTYDFGDDWVHDILVEDVVPYKERFAKVLKSKGPYMIEDLREDYGDFMSLI